MITLDNGINKVSMQRITFGPNNYDNEDEIDKYFNLLAERNTSTPGFGKGDFVSYYIELKESLLN